MGSNMQVNEQVKTTGNVVQEANGGLNLWFSFFSLLLSLLPISRSLYLLISFIFGGDLNLGRIFLAVEGCASLTPKDRVTADKSEER